MGLVKLSARWVPRLLTEHQKAQRVEISRANLDRADQHGGWDSFREQIVTGDETWIPHFAPFTKSQSMVWAIKGSDPPIKAQQQPHVQKIMVTVFFDCQGPLTIDFLEPNMTVNADRYVQTLSRLRRDISNRRSSGQKLLLLLHDNVRCIQPKDTRG